MDLNYSNEDILYQTRGDFLPQGDRRPGAIEP